jgi:ketosteroid isomerase-like protein
MVDLLGGGVRARDTEQGMSGENVELVREALAAFVEVDEGLAGPQRLNEFFAEDGIVTLSGFVEELVILHGVDEFLEFRAAWMEPYDDWMYDVEKIIDAGGNRVVATLYQRGRSHDSDSWIEMRYGLIYTIEEGLISRAEFYARPEDAIKATGLEE